jgi:hypothetical protein
MPNNNISSPVSNIATSSLPRDRAIAFIAKARKIHAEWIVYLDAMEPEERMELVPMQEVAGDIDYHREWVAQYDEVAAELRGPREDG